MRLKSGDWVELYNLSGEDVDLSGWHCDNPWNLNKWTFAGRLLRQMAI